MDIPRDTFLLLILVMRVVVGGWLLPSALGKLTNISQFTDGVRAYRILPDPIIPLFSWVLPWVELTLALLLLLGLYVPWAALGASLLVSCLTVAVVMNLRRGRTIACQCHGLAGNHPITWGIVARNLLLIGLSGGLGLAALLGTSWGSWVERWAVDRVLVGAPAHLVVLGCMLVCWWLVLALLEWTITVALQTARLAEEHV